MFQIDQSVKAVDLPSADLSPAQKEQILQFVMDKWKVLHTDLQSASFVLHPEYPHFLQHQNEEVVSGIAMRRRRDDGKNTP